MFTIEYTANNCNEHTLMVKDKRKIYIMDQERRRKEAVVTVAWEPPRAPQVKPQTRQLDLGCMPSFEDEIEDVLVQQLETVSTSVRSSKMRPKRKKQSSLPNSKPPVAVIESDPRGPVLVS